MDMRNSTALVSLVMFVAIACAEEGDVTVDSIKEWTSFKKSNGLAGNTILSFYEDSDGRMWIGTSEGVSVNDKSTFTSYSVSNTQGGLSGNTVYAVTETSEGELWFGTDNGLSFLDKNTWSNLPTISGFAYDVYALLVDQYEIVWIGTDNLGLLYYNGNSLFQIFDQTCNACNTINDLHLDNAGNLWVATGGGLKMFAKSKPDAAVKYYTTANGLAGNVVTTLTDDVWGNVWIGTYDGKTLTRHLDGKFYQQSVEDSFSSNWIVGLTGDRDGRLWIGTALMGVYRFDGATMRRQMETIPDQFIGAMTTDRNGNIWIGTYTQGIVLYKPIR